MSQLDKMWILYIYLFFDCLSYSYLIMYQLWLTSIS